MNAVHIERLQASDVDGLHILEQQCFTIPWSRQSLPSNPSLPHRSSLPLPRRPRYTPSTSSRSTSSLSPR